MGIQRKARRRIGPASPAPGTPPGSDAANRSLRESPVHLTRALASPQSKDVVRDEFKRKMRDRILDGAELAIGRIGLAKLNMLEVGRSAGVSRGTVYRYFPNREALLTALATREGDRLRAHLAEALKNTRTRADRFEVVMRHAAWHVREHPVLRQLSETDPDFLLRSIRKNFHSIRDTVEELVLPLTDDLAPIKLGIVTGDEFVDWITRILLSAYLFPDPNPERMSRAIAAYMRMLQEFGEQIPEET